MATRLTDEALAGMDQVMAAVQRAVQQAAAVRDCWLTDEEVEAAKLGMISAFDAEPRMGPVRP